MIRILRLGRSTIDQNVNYSCEALAEPEYGNEGSVACRTPRFQTSADLMVRMTISKRFTIFQVVLNQERTRGND